jgi:uncharacterized delta-60 repeat protein
MVLATKGAQMHVRTVAPLWLALALTSASAASAASGDYDPTFGDGGIAGFDGTLLGPQDSASDVRQRSDGRLLVAGEHGSAFAVLCLAPDGSLDSSFGAGGKLFVPEFGVGAHAFALAEQPDGLFVAAGATDDPTPVLVRFDDTGTLDPTFGTSGRVELGFAGGLAGVIVQPDGRIVGAGSRRTGVGLETDLLVVRLLPDGALDASFASGGVLTVDLDAFDQLVGVARQADGRLVAVGSGGTGVLSDRDLTLLRVDAAGALDPTFGTGGVARTDLGGSEHGVYLALQPDGKLVGGAFGADSYVLRWGSSGALDPDFGAAGVRTLPVASFAPGIALQPDGKIVAVATRGVPPTFVVARLYASGDFDPTFGAGGHRTNPFDGGGGSRSAILQADGRIVTPAQTAGGQLFSAVRFENGVCPDAPLPGCLDPTSGRLVIAARSGGHKVAWKWRGPPLDVATFGDPVETSAYTLCLYGAGGVLLHASALAGDGWRPAGTGFRYGAKPSSPHALSRVKLLANGTLKAVGRDLALGTPLPASLPLTAQLVRQDAPQCWTATYFPAGVKRNNTTRFKGRTGSPSGAFLDG